MTIFGPDFFIQFVLSYRGPLDVNNGQYVRSHKTIFLHYLETWLAVDLIAVMPIGLIYCWCAPRGSLRPPPRPRALAPSRVLSFAPGTG